MNTAVLPRELQGDTRPPRTRASSPPGIGALIPLGTSLSLLQERWEVPGAEYVQAPVLADGKEGGGGAATPAGAIHISARAAAASPGPAEAAPGAPPATRLAVGPYRVAAARMHVVPPCERDARAIINLHDLNIDNCVPGAEGEPGRGDQHRVRRFLPFSVGPRDCIGQNLARLNYQTTVPMLLAHFSFRLADGVGAAALIGATRKRWKIRTKAKKKTP